MTLYEQRQSGVDDFGAPVYTETPVDVDDVLIGEPSVDEITTSTAMYGKRMVCMLGIPKGDMHDWTDAHVAWTDAYGHTYHVQTFGFPITGIEENIPMRWHMKMRCEAYAG